MKKFTFAVILALLAVTAPAQAGLDDYALYTLSAGSPRSCKDVTRGETTATWTISGTWSGTITFKMVTDKTVTPSAPNTWWAQSTSTRQWTQTATANGVYITPVQGFNKICVDFTTATSGTPTVFVNLSDAFFADLSFITNPGTAKNSTLTSAANAAATTTITAASGQSVRLAGVTGVCSAGASTLTIQDGATTVFSAAVGATVTQFMFGGPGMVLTSGQAATISIAACGVGNTATLNVIGSQAF